MNIPHAHSLRLEEPGMVMLTDRFGYELCYMDDRDFAARREIAPGDFLVTDLEAEEPLPVILSKAQVSQASALLAGYLPLDEAERILIEAELTWDNTQAVTEGWAIFNLGDDLGTGIERDDEAALFPDDEAAQAMIQAQQTVYHQRATLIHHAADSVRFHLWGEEWVNSRMGPQP